MKIKILRPYLDYEVGKTYPVESVEQGRYMVAMSIGKEVVSKGGKSETDDVFPMPVLIPTPEPEITDAKTDFAPEPKAEVEPESKAEVEPESKAEVEPESKAEVAPKAKAEVAPKAKAKLTDEDLKLF